MTLILQIASDRRSEIVIKRGSCRVQLPRLIRVVCRNVDDSSLFDPFMIVLLLLTSYRPKLYMKLFDYFSEFTVALAQTTGNPEHAPELVHQDIT